jgi:hypothetical protein
VSAGLPADLLALNRTCGQAVVALAQALDNCVAISTMLGNPQRGFAVTGSGDSEVDPLAVAGMSPDDAALLRNSFFALSLLAQVAYGQTAQQGAEASNFFFDAQQLMGTTPL